MAVHLVFALFPLRPLSASISSAEGQTSTLLIRLAACRLGHFPGDAANSFAQREPLRSLGGSRSYTAVAEAGQAGACLCPTWEVTWASAVLPLSPCFQPQDSAGSSYSAHTPAWGCSGPSCTVLAALRLWLHGSTYRAAESPALQRHSILQSGWQSKLWFEFLANYFWGGETCPSSQTSVLEAH